MAKKIAVYFTDPDFNAYPFNEKEYNEGYHKLAEMISKQGTEFYIVRGQESYESGNKFKSSWFFKNGAFKKIEKTINFDLIFNKGILKVDKHAHMIVDPRLDEICTNKNRTYQLFKAYSPRTFVVKNHDELEKTLKKIPDEIVVAKPLDLYGGEGVLIEKKKDILLDVESFPYLIQELIDTSKGIPGLVKGRHDFRIYVINGEIPCALIRTPPTGGFISNVSRGGSFWLISDKEIPQSAIAVAMKIDKKLQKYGDRIYSIDLGFHKGKEWKIIELNCQPGISIDDYNDGEAGRKLFDMYAELLLHA